MAADRCSTSDSMRKKQMQEIMTFREIEATYDGDSMERMGDLIARITFTGPHDAESLVIIGSHYLLEFATQHVEHLDRLRKTSSEYGVTTLLDRAWCALSSIRMARTTSRNPLVSRVSS